MRGRRLISVPAFLLAWLLSLATAPLWLPLAAITDAVRRSGWVALRSASALLLYLSCEVVGLTACAALWIWGRAARVGPERWREAHFRLQAWWGATLFGGLVQLFDMRVEIEDDAELAHGLYVLLVRHASTFDTLLAAALVSHPHRIRLRYVLKRELLWDPCLDVVGNRLPNVFIDRFSSNPSRQIPRLRELASGIGTRDGVLIYPEGTRFSRAKRARVIERFRREGEEQLLDYARDLEFVLPALPGGTLGILEAAPDADVVVCAHTGFEGATSLAAIWNGALLRQTVRVGFWRVPRRAIPSGRDAAFGWLRDEWRRVDAWIAERANVD
jgi:1-acyl-sn-glycerol-3-phosphate acyltransferase